MGVARNDTTTQVSLFTSDLTGGAWGDGTLGEALACKPEDLPLVSGTYVKKQNKQTKTSHTVA